MKKTAKTDMKQAAELRVLSKAEILGRCAAKTETVAVRGWGAGVRMKTMTYPELIQLLADAGDDAEAKNAMVVAAVCEDLDVTDAYQLQKGNGFQFSALYQAVDNFLDFKVTDEKIKN